jgi:hypothetical protein
MNGKVEGGPFRVTGMTEQDGMCSAKVRREQSRPGNQKDVPSPVGYGCGALGRTSHPVHSQIECKDSPVIAAFLLISFLGAPGAYLGRGIRRTCPPQWGSAAGPQGRTSYPIHS